MSVEKNKMSSLLSSITLQIADITANIEPLSHYIAYLEGKTAACKSSFGRRSVDTITFNDITNLLTKQQNNEIKKHNKWIKEHTQKLHTEFTRSKEYETTTYESTAFLSYHIIGENDAIIEGLTPYMSNKKNLLVINSNFRGYMSLLEALRFAAILNGKPEKFMECLEMFNENIIATGKFLDGKKEKINTNLIKENTEFLQEHISVFEHYSLIDACSKIKPYVPESNKIVIQYTDQILSVLNGR